MSLDSPHPDAFPRAASSGTPTADAPPWEAAPAFLSRLADARPAPMLVEGLIPGDGITLAHADPRCLKTWLCLELALALTTDRPACGCLPANGPQPVWYITNEDGPIRLAERLRLLLAGHGLTAPPRLLYISAHRGLWLDDADSQARVVAAVKAHGVRLAILDPLRSLTSAVDAGPRELQPFALFLRTLAATTGCAVLASHHNTKPLVGQPDQRRRAHRASGGGLFSIADAPISIERPGDAARVIVTPDSWKFADTPGPLEISLEVCHGAARLVAQPVSRGVAADNALTQRILAFLDHTPGVTGSAVARGVRANKASVLAILDQLSSTNSVDAVRDRRRTTWFLRRGGAA